MVPESFEQVFESLAQAARSDQLLIFIGSGFSASQGLPTWRELAESLRNSSPDFTDLPGEFSKFVAKSGPLELSFFLERKLGQRPPGPHLITSLLLETRCAALVSTNCDRILETAAAQLGVPLRVFAEDSDLIDFHSTPAAKLIKLHGTLDRKDTLTFTREQYEVRPKNAPALFRTVAELMAYCRVLFLGYSISDPDLFEIIRLAGVGRPDRMSQMIGLFSRAELVDTWRRLVLDNRVRLNAPLLELAYEDFDDDPTIALAEFLRNLRERISPTDVPRLSKKCLIMTNGYTATLKTEVTAYLANCLGIPILATHRYGECTVDGLLQDSLRRKRYEEMLLDADSTLSRGYSVVLDGTFASREWRERAYELAMTYGAAPIIIKTICDDEVYIRSRLWRRKLDHSRSEHEVTRFENFVMTRQDVMAHPCEEDPNFKRSGTEVITFRNNGDRVVTVNEHASGDTKLIAELIKLSPLMSIAI